MTRLAVFVVFFSEKVHYFTRNFWNVWLRFCNMPGTVYPPWRRKRFVRVKMVGRNTIQRFVMTLIEAQNLSKNFGPIQAVRGVS